VTVFNPVKIHFCATDMVNGKLRKHDSDHEKCSLMILRGKCRLFYTVDSWRGWEQVYESEWEDDRYFVKGEIDYLSMADVQKALSSLIEKLETFPTRKESADRLHALAELLN
jgi:hypothetical protein